MRRYRYYYGLDLEYPSKDSCVQRGALGRWLDLGHCTHLCITAEFTANFAINRWGLVRRCRYTGLCSGRVYLPFRILLSSCASWLPRIEQLSSTMPSHYAIPALEPADHGPNREQEYYSTLGLGYSVLVTRKWAKKVSTYLYIHLMKQVK